jgi:hypothetical protein
LRSTLDEDEHVSLETIEKFIVSPLCGSLIGKARKNPLNRIEDDDDEDD